MIGRTIGPFEILSKLGEGGMGEVYLARDTRLGRTVAIKMLTAHPDLTGERRQRFLREARVVSTLNHPNIVTLYDIGEHEGQDFLVMEHVDGRTLDQLIGQRGLPVAQAVQYGRAIAEAMARAHAAGVLHRDLKPSNVIVAIDGTVKVLDFGLARLPEAAADEHAVTVTASPALTREGAVSGTPAYMSPEQAEGQRVDARSDIFSFGALMYELVAGVRAFQGTSAAGVLAAVLREDPKPVKSLGIAVPDALDTLIQRCLRKDPATRVQTMADVGAVLKELEAGTSGTNLAATTRRPRWVWWLAAAAIVGVAGFAGWNLWRSSRTNDADGSATRLIAMPLTSTFDIAEGRPTLSPDGSQVAYDARREGQTVNHIYLQVADAGATPVQLTDSAASDIWPTWSPDGRWIAFLRILPDKRRQTVRRSPVGAGETVILEGSCEFLAWTPDNRSILCSGAPDGIRGLRMFSSDGGDGRALTDPPEGAADIFPAVARDGRHLAFVRLVRAGPSYEIYELTLDNAGGVVGAPRLIRSFAGYAGYLTWNGPRELLLSARVGVDGTRIARLRTDQESAEPVWLDLPDGNLFRPVLSGAGDRLAYVQLTDQFEVRRARPGVDERHPAGSNRGERSGKFSPDGSQVALLSARSGQWDLWLADADARDAIRLTTVGGIEDFNWAPDGAFLVFAKRETSAFSAIYSVPITGGAPRRLTDGTHSDTVPSVSRDGQRIYFSSDRSTRREVYRMTVDGGNIEVVTAGGGDLPLETYDGQLIVFLRQTGGAHAQKGAGPLWVVPVAGGDERPLPVSSGGNFAIGRAGVYVTPFVNPTKAAVVSVCNPVTGDVRTIPNLLAGSRLSSVSPDGLTVLHTTNRDAQTDVMMVNKFR